MGLFETTHIPRTVVPPRRITANTVMPQENGANDCCPKCGASYVEGKNFCVECGASRIRRYSLSMGNKRMKAMELAAYLNQWLAENPYLYDVKISCDLHYLANDFDRLGQITASNVELSYSISDKPVNVQYGVEYLYSYRATFSMSEIMNSKTDQAVAQWQAVNPALKCCSFTGGKVTSTNGVYQLYALLVYAVPVSAEPTKAEETHPAPTVKFCRHCGQKLTSGGAFCSHCGQRL